MSHNHHPLYGSFVLGGIYVIINSLRMRRRGGYSYCNHFVCVSSVDCWCLAKRDAVGISTIF